MFEVYSVGPVSIIMWAFDFLKYVKTLSFDLANVISNLQCRHRH